MVLAGNVEGTFSEPAAQALAQFPDSLPGLRNRARHAVLAFRQESLDVVPEVPEPGAATPASLQMIYHLMPHFPGKLAVEIAEQLNVLDVREASWIGMKVAIGRGSSRGMSDVGQKGCGTGKCLRTPGRQPLRQ